ncbi:protein NRT1/ PTR FAMILY 1.2-like [Neltuma alba]|uniref:protein NRT1/ PTR FAMILY 1.2-like n=1 Tax=Neltuma alba TaxID=207710 RepID=UPI0010A542BE|nr:protein NRT1/ PTR FAMILY 1.2-like [Prosopis alba]
MEAMGSSCSSSGEGGTMARPPLLSQTQRRKGGFITMPFIIANEALAKVASLGIGPNMVLYLMGHYRLHIAAATRILLLSSAAGNFTPLVGAFLGDSYLGRFLAVGLGSVITFLGITLLWLTAMMPQARPPPCNQATEISSSATLGQMILLLSCFALMNIGTGGLGCSLAFGADQVNKKNNPNNQRVLEIFFSWYYASTAAAVIIAFTAIVYVQDHFGWKLGFGVPAALMFLSTFLFFLASPLYIKQNPTASLITSFSRVVAAWYKNRKLQLPPKNSSGRYHHEEGSDVLVPSDKLRFLNKACLIKDPEKDIAPDGSATNPWSLCTAREVEELKAIMKVIPLWSTGIMMSVNASQGSFPLLQAKSLNRHITSSFEIPAGSLTVIMIFTIFVWVGIYDRLLLPLASKIRGKPVRIGAKKRMGIGLFFYFLQLIVAAVVETIRRRKAIEEGHIDDVHAVLDMSIAWLFPQLCLAGIAEAFNAIGQQEFYYSEFPRSMSSIASSLFGLGMAGGNLVATIVFSTVDDITSRGGKQSWVSDNINRGRYDRYYWILVTMGGVNLLYYLFCSWVYGPTSDELPKENEEIASMEEDFTEAKNGDNDEKDK